MTITGRESQGEREPGTRTEWEGPWNWTPQEELGWWKGWRLQAWELSWKVGMYSECSRRSVEVGGGSVLWDPK